MKKILFVFSVMLALVVLSGASVWEGAAAVSSDFPESGFYIATNSFPRNTVVDLTNLETGKTVRVIVAAGLDTPGLLALVSREAADAIGLRSRTIGRIRMIAPQDPLAFTRFSDDDFLSGDPDFDPMAAVEEVYGRDAVQPSDSTPPVYIAETVPEEPPAGPVNGNGVNGTNGVNGINGTNGTNGHTDPIALVPVEDIETIPEPPAEEEPEIAEAPPVLVEEPEIAEAPPVLVEEPEIAEAPPVLVEEPEIVESPPVLIEEPEIVEAPPVLVEEPEIVEAPPEEDFPETSDAIAMVSNTRDPMVTDLPVDTTPAPVAVVEPEPTYTLTPSEPVYTPPAEPVYTPPPVSEPAISPEYTYTLIPADERPPSIPAETPPAAYVPPSTPVTPPPAAPSNFSVPAVLELESGKYYLQLGAYSHTPTVEMELAKIERGYPVTVQCISLSGNNVYRVLIGPVNQGEAGALLKKFQARGYKDAFVRRG